MSDAWEEIQAIKSKRNSLREKLEKRKKERQDILNLSSGGLSDNVSPLTKILHTEGGSSGVSSPVTVKPFDDQEDSNSQSATGAAAVSVADPDLEAQLLGALCDLSVALPVSSAALCATVARRLHNRPVSHDALKNLLLKLDTQQLISVREDTGSAGTGRGDGEGEGSLEVVSAEHAKLVAMVNEIGSTGTAQQTTHEATATAAKRKEGDDGAEGESAVKVPRLSSADAGEKKSRDKTTDIMSLLSMPSIKEKENKKLGEEILALLSRPTAKERSLAERFRSHGGAQVMEFCPHGTRAECTTPRCGKLHFKKIIQKHTDETLGDCSFLNTCFHMDTCKYVHYRVDGSTAQLREKGGGGAQAEGGPAEAATTLAPPQWVQCDLRYLDMTVLGKFAVIMADPPWDIHMELPYGTMSDDEMRQLGVPALQDDGLIFLWVTGRAMELGRECLKLWGYQRVDEIIWVKTNQLQRIIRTGRTGHWLNHGKEHCLVGMKGSPANLNRGLDCDVIVAEVRATSHKPDEIYGIIERLSPGTRKIELFGRPHNVQPNWITLGNQVDGVRLLDPELIEAFQKRYPDGNCMAPPKT